MYILLRTLAACTCGALVGMSIGAVLAHAAGAFLSRRYCGIFAAGLTGAIWYVLLVIFGADSIWLRWEPAIWLGAVFVIVALLAGLHLGQSVCCYGVRARRHARIGMLLLVICSGVVIAVEVGTGLGDEFSFVGFLLLLIPFAGLGAAAGGLTGPGRRLEDCYSGG